MKKIFNKNYISYEIVGGLITMIIMYVITNNIKSTISVGMVQLFVRPLIYFLRVKPWSKVNLEVVEEIKEVESTLLTGLPEKTQEKIKRLTYTKRTD